MCYLTCISLDDLLPDVPHYSVPQSLRATVYPSETYTPHAKETEFGLQNNCRRAGLYWELFFV